MDRRRARIRWVAILQTLRDTYNGVMLSTDGSDLIIELLKTFRKPDEDYLAMHQRLTELEAQGKIVIERIDQRIVTIALIDKRASVTPTVNGGTAMAAPKKAHRTVAPRDGEGRELPAHLSDEHCGPVVVTHIGDNAAEETAIAGMVVVEELDKVKNPSMNHREITNFIGAVLGDQYSGIALTAITAAVLEWLIANKHLEKGTDSRSKVLVYTVLRTSPSEKVDVNQLLKQVIADLEAARAENIHHVARIAEFEQAAKQQISQEQLRKILDDLQTARDAVGRLNAELRELKLAQARSDKEHAAAMKRLDSELAAAVKKWREAEDRFESAKSATLDPDLLKQLRDLGYGA